MKNIKLLELKSWDQYFPSKNGKNRDREQTMISKKPPRFTTLSLHSSKKRKKKKRLDGERRTRCLCHFTSRSCIDTIFVIPFFVSLENTNVVAQTAQEFALFLWRRGQKFVSHKEVLYFRKLKNPRYSSITVQAVFILLPERENCNRYCNLL